MDFLSDFVKATDHLPSPETFRLWCAIVAVSAVLGRKVYARFLNRKKITYANHFVVLVADAAGGKSQAIEEIKNLTDQFGDAIAFSNDMNTPEGQMQHMAEEFSNVDDMKIVSFNLMTDEIAMMLPNPDWTWWYQALAKLWDCQASVSKGTKTQGTDVITEPYVNMLCGGQPYWFAKGFPEGINKLGLPSRILFIYSDEKKKINLYAEPDDAAWRKAEDGLKRIYFMEGEMLVHEDVRAALQEWIDAGMPPYVKLDKMSEAYLHRRLHHLTKLAMVCAAATHPGQMEVTLADLERAKAILFEAEKNMHKAMGFLGTDASYHKEMAIVDFVATQPEPVPETEIRRKVMMDFPPNMRQAVLDNLVAAGHLKVSMVPGKGKRYSA